MVMPHGFDPLTHTILARSLDGRYAIQKLHFSVRHLSRLEYYGGTNFGRTSSDLFITTPYDYDELLDEYGNSNQPKLGHLKQLYASIKLEDKILTNGTRSNQDYGSSVTLMKFSNPSTGERFCFLSNTDGSNDATIAWSVSILDGCNKEVYNTAKVNSRTSIFVKKECKTHIDLGSGAHEQHTTRNW
ncbi:hypothetical protein Csa_021532 [Cucumis sativus]|nr:hypothetical protein Csa_021532 [Cucumis sativus]